MGEVLWLEPYPDLLLEGLIDTAPSPEARYEAREAISLAFVTALQLLPPRQRAALVLRDVLDFSVREVAQILQTTQDAVASALKRARATLARELSPAAEREAPPTPNSAMEQDLAARLASAFERGDVQGVVSLLTDDAWVRMPPIPLEYQGRELATQFFSAGFRHGRRFRLVATRANGQPAFGLYIRDPRAGIAHANGLLVLTLVGTGSARSPDSNPASFPASGYHGPCPTKASPSAATRSDHSHGARAEGRPAATQPRTAVGNVRSCRDEIRRLEHDSEPDVLWAAHQRHVHLPEGIRDRCRSLLVPALVSLFGRWNWWMLAWAERMLLLRPVAGPQAREQGVDGAFRPWVRAPVTGKGAGEQ
jgi:hypothetical protein